MKIRSGFVSNSSSSSFIAVIPESRIRKLSEKSHYFKSLILAGWINDGCETHLTVQEGVVLNKKDYIIINGSIGLVLIALALLPPMRGVHRKIRQSKEAALRWVNGEISKQLNAFENSDTGRASGEIADLVAYQGLVQGVPEWPFTTSTYTRLILYAFIPVVSWSIGIVAEGILGRALF